jgi:hypothetical protein
MFFPKFNTNEEISIEYMQENVDAITYDDKNDDNNDTDIEDKPERNIASINCKNNLENKNKTTRSGRATVIPKKCEDYLMIMKEPRQNKTLLIGAGLNEGITHILELQVKNYSKAMASHDNENWLK